MKGLVEGLNVHNFRFLKEPVLFLITVTNSEYLIQSAQAYVTRGRKHHELLTWNIRSKGALHAG